MNIFNLFVTLLFCSAVKATVLLVPEKSVPFETYKEQCNKPGYLCTIDFLRSEILNNKSALFEKFIESINYHDQLFKQKLYINIKKIISEEMIDLDEVSTLISVLDKSDLTSSNSYIKSLRQELVDVSEALEIIELEYSEQENYIIFKKVISRKQYLSIKPKISLIQILYINSYFEPRNTILKNESSKLLLNGDCKNFEISNFLKSSSTHIQMPVFKNDCSSFFEFSKLTYEGSILQKYEKPIIYTVIGVGLAVLLSKYNFEFK